MSETAARVFRLPPAESHHLSSLCGKYDENIKQIENYLKVKIEQRHHTFRIAGEGDSTERAEAVMRDLFERACAQSGQIDAEQVHLALVRGGTDHPDPEPDADEPVIRVQRRQIRAQNPNQADYLRALTRHDLNFAIGPAGTGKTYLAVAAAVAALAEERCSRLVLVRPVVEAGERLGFLPGDIGQKIDPYMRPLCDALYELLGFERTGRLISRGTIELAPLAYMRGRTLNSAFVILDEAQNTTCGQMQMFLTRIGFNTRVVVTGDPSQIDLPPKQLSGLKHAGRVLAGVEGIGFTRLTATDVVRHPLVQRIVRAYADDPTPPETTSEA